MTARPVELKVETGPSVTGALDRVVDAAQSVVADQIGLARLETVAAARRLLRAVVLLILGGLLLLGAWGTLSIAVYELLAPLLPPAARLGIIAAAHAVVGTVLVMLGLQQERDG